MITEAVPKELSQELHHRSDYFSLEISKKCLNKCVNENKIECNNIIKNRNVIYDQNNEMKYNYANKSDAKPMFTDSHKQQEY